MHIENADDTTALEDHLKKVGAVPAPYGPPPSAGSSTRALTDGERSDCVVKLISHVRLHLLYLAEKLQ